MKNFIFSILLVLISFIGYSQTTKVLNGNKEKEDIRYDATGLYYKNKPYTGIYEEYDDNGQLSTKGSYLNGKANGVREYYYDNGQLRSKGSYLNGKKSGIWEYYNEDGSLVRTETN